MRLSSQLFRKSALTTLSSCSSLQCRFNHNSALKQATKEHRKIPEDGKNLSDFIVNTSPRRRLPKINPSPAESSGYLSSADLDGGRRTVKFITYGCQMNVNDMEIVRSILSTHNYVETDDANQADNVVLMTCSIREGAEEKVWSKLRSIRRETSKKQIVGVLGCMAERVRHGLLSQKGLVDLVAGPDSYRDLPRLFAVARAGTNAINVQLSLDETYADVVPVRLDESSRSAYVSIMRGCDNMCTYCVVPLTRGRERSRPIDSIIEEVERLSDKGVKQITLLGQNVNSYRDMSETSIEMQSMLTTSTAPGFNTVYKPRVGGRTFATLLEKISDVDPEMRIRFTSPHPKDFPMEVISLIRERNNICNQLHMPAQSGNNDILHRMGRGYTREAYLNLVNDVRSILPDVAITSDFIAGFCGESEEAHLDTVKLIKEVGYSFCFVFPYSLRERTRAHYHLVDDVPEDVKSRRHTELRDVFRSVANEFHQQLIGTKQLVLVEGVSKRSDQHLQGRADGGSKVVFPKLTDVKAGDYVEVKIHDCTSQTLLGSPIRQSNLREFYSNVS